MAVLNRNGGFWVDEIPFFFLKMTDKKLKHVIQDNRIENEVMLQRSAIMLQKK